MASLSNSPFHVANEKTRVDLDYAGVLHALSLRTRTAAGEKAALDLAFAATFELSLERIAEVQEAIALEDAGSPLPVQACPDVSVSVQHLSVQGVLQAADFVDLLRALRAIETLRRFFSNRADAYPRLYASTKTAPELAQLVRSLEVSFDEDGSISDNASTKLASLRAEHKLAKSRLLARAQEVLRDHASVLQDAYVTEREGRYVVPLRADAHERFPGIVHGASASGGTLFVEPKALIPLGNRLRVLAVDIEREEYAVLARLSSECAVFAAELKAAAQVLELADLRAAAARLAVEFKMRFPDIAKPGEIELRDLRHPLLAFDGVRVVPSDMRIHGGQALVVSGPNAGGKTVALKAVGLAALMLRAGLPIACAEGSRMGLFTQVISDVGDDQSLRSNLSTFSAHLTHVVATLSQARSGCLVLLDELASGTDPREGEALAAGVLGHLCDAGATTVVTTHYEGLKALALTDVRYKNASVGIDLDTMIPSFKLTLGVPGVSQAFALAERLSMPADVLAVGRAFLAGEDRDFEATVRDLDRARGELERAKAELAAKMEELDAERQLVKAELARMRSKDEKLLHKDLEDIRAGIAKARSELARAKEALSKRGADADLKAITKTLQVAGELVPDAPIEEPARQLGPQPRAEELKPQMRVWHMELRKEVLVLEASGSAVRVQAGPMKLSVRPAMLRLLPDGGKRLPAKPAAPSKPKGQGADDGVHVAIQTSSNTCDLRGMRADEALNEMQAFLDRAHRRGEDVVFIVHGHGTGALRDVVRDELHGRRDVAHFRLGGPGEGGDGATLVWLAL